MFPRSQRFHSLLLEEIEASYRWCPFVCDTLTESAKLEVLSQVLATGSHESVTDQRLAEAWVDQVNSVISPMEKLAKHCARTSQQALRRYINESTRMIGEFRRKATKERFDNLRRRSACSSRLHEAVRCGKNVNGLAEELLRVESKTTSPLIESLVDHEKFIRKLESTFKLSVSEFEPIREGVFVYLDQDNSNKLESALDTQQEVFDTINDKMGYLLLRKGVKSDMQFGPFGESLLCWTFVYAPVEDQKDDSGEEDKKPFKTLKLKMIDKGEDE